MEDCGGGLVRNREEIRVSTLIDRLTDRLIALEYNLTAPKFDSTVSK